MTERSPECWVCEAILLDWVVLGIRALEVLRGAVLKHCEHCPHTNDTDLGTLWRFNTWNLAASSSSRQLVLSVQGPATLSICNAEARYPMRIASAMLSSNWEKQNAPFMFIMSVLSPTLGTTAPMLWGHKYGKSISWQNNELLLQISLCLKSFNPCHTSITPKVCKQEVSPAYQFRGSRSNRKTTANCRRING